MAVGPGHQFCAWRAFPAFTNTCFILVAKKQGPYILILLGGGGLEWACSVLQCSLGFLPSLVHFNIVPKVFTGIWGSLSDSLSPSSAPTPATHPFA